ncbi:hypothetical protein AMTR_s00103p00061650 [Amborella trichopoda]|uniref:ATPase family AAA domain-containing protein n=1 Tax=Amborella trichopoda TaxID=13333 RepID=W1NYV3_AMBTC|nr:hypothetical protein AMTR_s00103p00061650 [Amborella trichopoda]
MAKACALGLAAVASASLAIENVYADGPFRFGSFSSAPQASPESPSKVPQSPVAEAHSEETRVRNNYPRTTAAGFDPEALERGAAALREIEKSRLASEVLKTVKKQEETRQAELATKKAELQAQQAQHETERQRVIYEEQKKLIQQQAQTKAQMAQYEDELARKRMKAEHDSQRARNEELVKMQEESAIRLERARRATEEEINAQRLKTEKERAAIERETIGLRPLQKQKGELMKQN